jgi:hypothetical protein
MVGDVEVVMDVVVKVIAVVVDDGMIVVVVMTLVLQEWIVMVVNRNLSTSD